MYLEQKNKKKIVPQYSLFSAIFPLNSQRWKIGTILSFPPLHQPIVINDISNKIALDHGRMAVI